MANGIYDSTWWGNTIQTASSIGTSTEMIQGQFNLTKLGDELVTNGDFATDTDWTKSAQTTISSGKANLLNASAFSFALSQVTSLTVGKKYLVEYNISEHTTGSIRVRLGSSLGTTRNGNGTFSQEIIAQSNAIAFQPTSTFTGSIDNISVKLVREATVEAVKCLADAIHRIGIQDIQN